MKPETNKYIPKINNKSASEKKSVLVRLDFFETTPTAVIANINIKIVPLGAVKTSERKGIGETDLFRVTFSHQ